MIWLINIVEARCLCAAVCVATPEHSSVMCVTLWRHSHTPPPPAEHKRTAMKSDCNCCFYFITQWETVIAFGITNKACEICYNLLCFRHFDISLFLALSYPFKVCKSSRWLSYKTAYSLFLYILTLITARRKCQQNSKSWKQKLWRKETRFT